MCPPLGLARDIFEIVWRIVWARAIGKESIRAVEAAAEDVESRPASVPPTSDGVYRFGDIAQLKVLAQGDAPDEASNSTMNVRIRKVVTQPYSFTTVVDIVSEGLSRTGSCSDSM